MIMHPSIHGWFNFSWLLSDYGLPNAFVESTPDLYKCFVQAVSCQYQRVTKDSPDLNPLFLFENSFFLYATDMLL